MANLAELMTANVEPCGILGLSPHLLLALVLQPLGGLPYGLKRNTPSLGRR